LARHCEEISFEGPTTLPLPARQKEAGKATGRKPAQPFITKLAAMQMLPSPVDRLGVALRALRQAYAGGSDAEDKTALGAKCLHVLIAQLAQEGVAQEDLQPLIDLETIIEALKSQAQGESVPNRGKQRPRSDILLARFAAVIEAVPASSGYSAFLISGSRTEEGSRSDENLIQPSWMCYRTLRLRCHLRFGRRRGDRLHGFRLHRLSTRAGFDLGVDLGNIVANPGLHVGDGLTERGL
jgi:hypothetical protein